MKLLVTGANGFLGRRVVAAAQSAGHDVRALIRPATSTAALAWTPEVEVFRADLRGGCDLRPAFEDVDVLIHLAAGVSGTEEQQFQSTVAGTERLCEAMSCSRTRRIVLASSFYVYDWDRARREITESSPLVADPYERDGYTISKVWQERVTRRYSEQHGWELVVLRPGFIWGRGNEWPARVGMPLSRWLAVVGPLSDAGLTHVDNCAEYFIRAAESETAAGQTLNVFDGHAVSNWRFAGEFARRQSPTPWRLPWPYVVGRAMALGARLASRLVYGRQGKLPSLLVPNLFQARFRPLKFPNTHLTQLLGHPELTFAQCLERTFAAHPPDTRPPQLPGSSRSQAQTEELVGSHA